MEASKRLKLTADALKQFQQGVSLVFSGWVALQDAVNGGWGGLYSREKAVSIESSVLSFFCQPKKNEVLLCEGMDSMSLLDNEVECEEVIGNDDDDDNVDMGNNVGPSMMIDSLDTSSKNEVASQDMEVDGWVPVSRKKIKGRKK